VVVNWQAVPSELMKLPLLEKVYLDNNKITLLPPEVGQLTRLQVLQCDYNALVSVPGVLQFPDHRLCSRPEVKIHP
jgi:Leucine-rich repeat (LRR) protein